MVILVLVLFCGNWWFNYNNSKTHYTICKSRTLFLHHCVQLFHQLCLISQFTDLLDVGARIPTTKNSSLNLGIQDMIVWKFLHWIILSPIYQINEISLQKFDKIFRNKTEQAFSLIGLIMNDKVLMTACCNLLGQLWVGQLW